MNQFEEAVNLLGGVPQEQPDPQPKPEVNNDPVLPEPEEDDFNEEELETFEREQNGEPRDEEEAPKKVKIKINGEEKELDLQAVVEGYQKGEDYTRKTQKLAEERKAFEQQQQQIAQIQEQYTAKLKQIEKLLSTPSEIQQQMQQAAAEEDWANYNKLQFQEQQRTAGQKVLEAELQKEQEAQQQKQAEHYQQYLQQQMQFLHEKAPELVKPEHQKRLTEYLLEVGYAQQEIDAAADARSLLLAEKARKYDALMAKRKPSPDAPIAKTLSSKPKRTSAADVDTAKREDLMRRVKTGKSKLSRMQSASQLLN